MCFSISISHSSKILKSMFKNDSSGGFLSLNKKYYLRMKIANFCYREPFQTYEKYL